MGFVGFLVGLGVLLVQRALALVILFLMFVGERYVLLVLLLVCRAWWGWCLVFFEMVCSYLYWKLFVV